MSMIAVKIVAKASATGIAYQIPSRLKKFGNIHTAGTKNNSWRDIDKKIETLGLPID